MVLEVGSVSAVRAGEKKGLTTIKHEMFYDKDRVQKSPSKRHLTLTLGSQRMVT